jgi:tetratricopeptide (TPR) repeat protein
MADYIELAKQLAWPVVIFVALIVLIIYRKPIGDVLSNMTKGKVTSKKGEGFSVDFEVDKHSREQLQEAENDSGERLVPIIDSKQEMEVDATKDWYYLFSQGEYREAYELIMLELQQAEQVDPSNGDKILWLRMSKARIQCQINYEQGKKEYLSVMEDYPNSSRVSRSFMEVAASFGRLDDAFGVSDGFSGDKKQKYYVLLKKAEILFGKSDFENLGTLLDELNLQKDNDYVNAMAYILRGRVLRKEEKFEDANQSLLRGYKALPTDTSILSEVVKYFSDNSDLKHELFFIYEILKQDSGDSSTWGSLGNVCLRLNLNDTAMNAYEKADELIPETPWVLGNIGNLYNNLKLYSKAVAYLNRSAKIDVSMQYTHERLGRALQNQADERKQVEGILEEIKTEIMRL